MMRPFLAVALLLGAGREAAAQRPSTSSICDYYAGQKYGASNSTTQFKLMEHIVALAFGGGTSLPDASPNSTGILNPGFFQGQSVYLRSWFDGSKATTNLNNQPVGIDWLDSGAQDPLIAFLNGTTPDVLIPTGTNEYRLFTHFFSAFGFVFGCSQVSSFPKTNETGGFISLAYVHKFMNLNQTDLGYFIGQLTTASRYFGFSDTDADTLETFMNAKYNVRCAPPVNGQLNSLCQAPECPLAAPSPDCDPYVNIGPSGVGNGTSPPPQTSAPPPSASSATASASTTPSPSGTAPATSSSSASLSTGTIAGIAIGGAAVLLIALGLALFFFRRPARRQPSIIPVPYPAGGYGSPSQPSYATNPHTSFSPSGVTNTHDSYVGFGGAPGFYAPGPKPDDVPMAGGHGVPQQQQESPRPPPQMAEIAEMDSPSPGGPVRHSGVPSQMSASPMGYGDSVPRWDGPRSP